MMHMAYIGSAMQKMILHKITLLSLWDFYSLYPIYKKISIWTCLVHYFTTWMFFRCISTHYFHTIVYSTLTALVNCAWKVIIHARWSKNLHSMNALHVYCYFIRLSQPLCSLLKNVKHCTKPLKKDLYMDLKNLLMQTSVYLRELCVNINEIFRLHGGFWKLFNLSICCTYLLATKIQMKLPN